MVLGTNGMPAVRMDVFYSSRFHFPLRFCGLSTVCYSICFMLQFPYQRIPDMCLEAHQCGVSRTQRNYQKISVTSGFLYCMTELVRGENKNSDWFILQYGPLRIDFDKVLL